MSSDESTMHMIRKAVVTGGISGGLLALNSGKLLYWPKTISVKGTPMNAYVVAGIGMGAASLAADLAHQYVMPLVFTNQKWEDATAPVLEAGMSGAGMVAVSQVLNRNLIRVVGVPKLFAIGAGLGAVGSYLTEKWVNPWLEAAA